jgi:carbonic anhydrase
MALSHSFAVSWRGVRRPARHHQHASTYGLDLEGPSLGLIDNRLRHIQDVRDRYVDFLAALPDNTTRWRALCELKVIEQVRDVARTILVGDAWKRGQPLMLHAWIYGLEDGRLQDLQGSFSEEAEVDSVIAEAVAVVHSRYTTNRTARE